MSKADDFLERFHGWLAEIDMAGPAPAIERVQELLLRAPDETKTPSGDEQAGIQMLWFYFGFYQGRLLHEELTEPEPPELAKLLLRLKGGA